jgi:hypothetical protein
LRLAAPQALEIHESWIPLSGCALCVEALMAALKVRVNAQRNAAAEQKHKATMAEA